MKKQHLPFLALLSLLLWGCAPKENLPETTGFTAPESSAAVTEAAQVPAATLGDPLPIQQAPATEASLPTAAATSPKEVVDWEETTPATVPTTVPTAPPAPTEPPIATDPGITAPQPETFPPATLPPVTLPPAEDDHYGGMGENEGEIDFS